MDKAESGWEGLAVSPSLPGGADAALLARQTARLFASPEGEALLAHLRKITLDRCLGPESSKSALRHLEGQRHLVLHLLSLAARGRAGQ
ncbi:Bbp19 family protein [Magnetospirillum molischianum]|uniref:Bbp19-like phage domain-containing protein n=1 Tax=Magnetospirillum molischianum DSM 120 TaxID=1150626 RepID=H8FUD4_MAGML|nr:hypothetical protein [Magnetospirillum molischianum]CCG41972.1 conserved hypothetical protein [Magnetospirillum molischianum DSM 120]